MTTPETDILYRLWRLRRLWAAMLAVPVAAGSLVAVVTAGGSVLADPTTALALSVLWALAAAALILRFPRAATELLALTLATGIMVLGLPLAEALVGLKPTHVNAGDLIWLGLLLAVLWFILFMVCAVLYPRLHGLGQRRTRQTRYSFRSSLPAEQVFAGLAYAPDLDGPVHVTGPVDADGFFPVYVDYNMTPPEGSVDLPDAPMDEPLDDRLSCDYRVRIMDQGPLSQTILIAAGAETDTSACQFSVIPLKSGCLLQSHEVHSHFTPCMAFECWLTDFGSDSYSAQLDRLAGKPARANRAQPFDSPMCWIARQMPRPDSPVF